MKEKKTKSIENGSFYLVLGACVLVIALIGYMSSRASKDSTPPQDLAQNIDQQTLPTPDTIPTQTPAPVTAPKKATTPETTVQSSTPVSRPVADVEDMPHFIAPVHGNVQVDFSGDKLVFNNTTADWRTHDGVDFTANINDDVLAAADGIVEKIYAGSLGNCILIGHANGYKTLYANLADIADQSVGDEIRQGTVIGKIGESALADFSEDAHLHFEMLCDGKNVNPLEYIE